MSLVEVRFAAKDIEQAQRLVRVAARELDRVTPAGTYEQPLPRCEHPRWSGSERYVAKLLKGRGRVAPCTCKTWTDPDPDCPHVRWPPEIQTDGDELVVMLEEHDLAILVGRDEAIAAEAREGRIEAVAAKVRGEDADPLPVAWSEREDRRERKRAALRETVPAPPERGARR